MHTGREFYGCSKPIHEGCSFFQWGDFSADGGGTGGNRRNTSDVTNGHAGSGYGQLGRLVLGAN